MLSSLPHALVIMPRPLPRVSARRADNRRELFEAAYQEWSEFGRDCEDLHYRHRGRLFSYLVGTDSQPGLLARWVRSRLGGNSMDSDEVVRNAATELVHGAALFFRPPAEVVSYQALVLARAELRTRDHLRRQKDERAVVTLDDDDGLETPMEDEAPFSDEQIHFGTLVLRSERECVAELAATPAARTAPPDVNRFRAAVYAHLSHEEGRLAKVCAAWNRERRSGTRARRDATRLIRECLERKGGELVSLSHEERTVLWPRAVSALVDRVQHREGGESRE